MHISFLEEAAIFGALQTREASDAAAIGINIPLT
jgi:hypothetical protein